MYTLHQVTSPAAVSGGFNVGTAAIAFVRR